MLGNLARRLARSWRPTPATPPLPPPPQPPPSAPPDPEDEYLRALEADPELSLEQKVRYWRREGFILSDLVQEALPVSERVVVLDVGARDAFLDSRWRGFRADRIEFLGFEANAEEAARLNEEAAARGTRCRYFGIGAWSEKGERTLYETQSPGGSSFYLPNGPVVERWKFQSETHTMRGGDVLEVARAYPVATDTLDAILASEAPGTPVDFMKLNIQGAELPVLQGASATLRDVLGVQTEVSFVESYVGRPMFSDVDAHLRAQGFEFFDFVAPHYMGRVRSPLTARQMPGLFGLYGQNVEGHVLYLRDPIRLAEIRPEWLRGLNEVRALKLVAIAETYHQVEFALELLFWLEEHFSKCGASSSASVMAELRRLGLKRHEAYMRWHSERFDRMTGRA